MSYATTIDEIAKLESIIGQEVCFAASGAAIDFDGGFASNMSPPEEIGILHSIDYEPAQLLLKRVVILTSQCLEDIAIVPSEYGTVDLHQKLKYAGQVVFDTSVADDYAIHAVEQVYDALDNF